MSTGAPLRSTPRILGTVLLPFALAHFISYLYRSVNAVVYPDLVRELGLNANTLGLLTSAYFIAFAVAQLPVGVALDRFGPRRVQMPMLTIATGGALLFASADSLGGLLLGRALIGFGVAASLMSAIKASTLWLPPQRLPLVTSVLLAVGGVGAVVSTAPMQALLEVASWRTAFLLLAAATIGIAALIGLAVPEQPTRGTPPPLADMVRAIGQLYRAPSFWRQSLITLFCNAAYMAIQGLWLGPWLRDVAQLSRPDTAQVLLWGTVAMVAGSLSFGWAADRLQALGVRPMLLCGAGLLVFVTCEALMAAGVVAAPLALVLAFSFFGSSGALNYAIIAQSVPAHLTGRVSTCFNLLIFLASFAVQWGMGAIIGLWAPLDGQYPVQAYRAALLLVVALQTPGIVLWLLERPWTRAT